MMAALNPSAPDPSAEWTGERRRYDLVKELVIALAVVLVLTILLAALFSSPDSRPLTIARWAHADPADFVTTALAELDGSSDLAGYGQPYNNTPDAAQKIGPVSLQRLFGVRIPIDPAQAFVLQPLQTDAGRDATLAQALVAYRAATESQKTAWTDAYGKALEHATFNGNQIVMPSGSYGPVAPMMQSLLSQATSGALDGALVTTGQFYQTDYTKPLLFMADGEYLGSLAEKEHLLGSEWGMMNETGRYPGQAWLWLYTFWYQIRPFSNSGNADVLIWAVMAILTLGLLLIPFIPGLRSLPRATRVYRFIWRDYYRRVESPQARARD